MPAPGDWGSIEIRGGSATLDYTTFRYGGSGYPYAPLQATAGASLTLMNSSVSYSSGNGIWLNGTGVALSVGSGGSGCLDRIS